ncbi:MAG: 2-hydroxyacid dehydrogenase [Planctomycetota bacterium]|jgi:D-lactate dehydrogenase|nr:2-hydroxyacid dehydrogenase [Planctomycetota bacterium]
MRVAFFSTRAGERAYFDQANHSHHHQLVYHDGRLRLESLELAAGCQAVCCAVGDMLDASVLEGLAQLDIHLIALRCVGFNNVDLERAESLGITVVRVPAYPPHSIAEHALALALSLARRTHRAYNRVRDGDVSLDGFLGFQLQGATAAVIGTGRIGCRVAECLQGLGCRVVAADPVVNPSCRVTYTDFATCLAEADLITLHCPLTPRTESLIDARAIRGIKPGALLINTSRGGLLDIDAVAEGLESGQLGALGLDIYEEDEGLYFTETEDRALLANRWAPLLRFPNVLITAHQACYTREALSAIAITTVANISDIERGGDCVNAI